MSNPAESVRPALRRIDRIRSGTVSGEAWRTQGGKRYSVILSGAHRSRRTPWHYLKLLSRDSSTPLGMTGGLPSTLRIERTLRRITVSRSGPNYQEYCVE